MQIKYQIKKLPKTLKACIHLCSQDFYIKYKGRIKTLPKLLSIFSILGKPSTWKIANL